jgi:hypothetical protein
MHAAAGRIGDSFPLRIFCEPGIPWLRDHVVVMPVHQGLKKEDLALMVALLHGWEESKGNRI